MEKESRKKEALHNDKDKELLEISIGQFDKQKDVWIRFWGWSNCFLNLRTGMGMALLVT